MQTNPKIIAAIALVASVVPGISVAQTVSVAHLQVEIQDLTSELQSLETQLADARKSTNISWCYTFNSNLSIGMSGSAVTALQTALQKDGESVQVTGTFDDQTASAVNEFQQKYSSEVLTPNDLSYGTGYAGKSTRAELNALFGCGTETPGGGNPPTSSPTGPCGPGSSLCNPAPTPNPTSTPSTKAPVIQSVIPSTISPATTDVQEPFTITGTGFTATGNVLIFTTDPAPAYIPSPVGAEPVDAGQTTFYESSEFSNPLSSNGTSISFVDNALNNDYYLDLYSWGGGAGDGWQIDSPGDSLPTCTYTMYVENGDGAVSNGVTFTVTTSTGAVGISLSPAETNLSIIQGQSPATYTFATTTWSVSPDQAVNWVETSMPTWGTVSYNNHTAQNGTSIYLGLNGFAANLAPGTYNGSYDFAPAANHTVTFSPITVNVTLTVVSSATSSSND